MITTVACALVAGVLSAGAEADVSIPFEKYVIESNGLEVILSEDHQLPIVAVNLWYHAGPINEAVGRTGFAHLFEHLMFQGSKNVGDDQHFKLLEAAGASMINGTTDYDRTNYFETVPSNRLELALWLESDRMGFLLDTLTQEKLDNQRQVVMNERRQSVENVPYGPSGEKMVQTLFPSDHPYYGYVIGSMKDLDAASLDDVHAFFERYYAPANATLVVAGDIDPTATKALIAKYFGSLARRPAPADRPVQTPPITSERVETVEEPIQLARVQLGWLAPASFAPGDADCDVLAFILGHGKTSRLYKRLVYELEIAQTVSASQESLALASIFTVTVTGRPGVDVEKLQTETQKVLDAIRAAPPKKREVLRARNRLVTHKITGLQRLGGFGGRADLLNRYNLYLDDPDYLAQDMARYDAVTPTTVHALAKTLLASDKRAVVITVPAK
ncbi:MAG: pitrilysin family protein [Myxococcota bacterium]